MSRTAAPLASLCLWAPCCICCDSCHANLCVCPPRAAVRGWGGVLFAVEDLERNDGSAEKPYFMSPDLKKLLKKTNKGQPDA